MSHKKTNLSKGFTLVEIAVVIAIMAVLVAVLAPALLRNVEDSRAQKDESAMNEVAHAVKLAMSDAEVFDEVCSYAIANNYITYTDSSGVYGAQYTDEEFWAPDGSGRAVTITFNPEENGTYVLEHGLVNDMTYGNGSVADSRTAEGLKQCYLSEMGDGKLYTKLKSTIGTTIEETSATYKNSSYTVFITIETVGDMKHAECYGLFNGTNLSPGCLASLGSGTTEYTPEQEAKTTKPGGTTESNYNNSDLTGGGGTPPYVHNKDIENLQNFEYYSSFALAIQDVNSNSIGARADVDQTEGVAAISLDNGRPVVVLQKDHTETSTVTVNKDVTINLNGHILTFENIEKGLEIASGSTIIKGNYGQLVATNHTSNVYAIYSCGNLKIDGGTYRANGTSADKVGHVIRIESGFGDIKNAKIESRGQNKSIHGIAVNVNGSATITNCDITTYANATSESRCYGIYSKGQATAKGCNIKSTSHALGGVVNVDGGTYLATATPVFICAADPAMPKTATMRNAHFGYMPIPEGYSYTSGTINIIIFGGHEETKDMTVWMDNCWLTSGGIKTTAIRQQSAYNERNLTLNISRTTVDMPDMNNSVFVNYESQGHKLYIGQGCNFGPEHTVSPNVAFTTNEIY